MNSIQPWVVFFLQSDAAHARVEKIASSVVIGHKGRQKAQQIKLSQSFLKREHGRIVVGGGALSYEDMSGQPTTLCDGQFLAPKHGVRIGDNSVVVVRDESGGQYVAFVVARQQSRAQAVWSRRVVPAGQLESLPNGRIVEDDHAFALRIDGDVWVQPKVVPVSSEPHSEAGVLDINVREVTVGSLWRKRTLLQDVKLQVKPGEMVLILGSSGAGKTTFLDAITGSRNASAEVRLNGVDILTNQELHRKVARRVQQHGRLREGDTVRATLTDAYKINNGGAHKGRKEIKARVDEVLQTFGFVEADEKKLVRSLSGGQAKRLSIAVEYIANPQIFYLDEPDSGLDPEIARSIMDRLKKIAKTENKIVMVISHSADDYQDVFDKVLVLGRDSRRNCATTVFYGSKKEATEFFEVSTFSEMIAAISKKDKKGNLCADSHIDRFASLGK